MYKKKILTVVNIFTKKNLKSDIKAKLSNKQINEVTFILTHYYFVIYYFCFCFTFRPLLCVPLFLLFVK